VRQAGVFLFGQVLFDQAAQLAFGARRQPAQVLRESLHVLVVLRRIELERGAVERALGLGPVKRMLQEVVLLDECVQRGNQCFSGVILH
jgi:hypothetical protein